MKVFLLLLLAPSLVFSQTALIFHKSHSGSAASFVSVRNGNFGDPPDMYKSLPSVNPMLTQEITRINDSVVVVKSSWFPESDTIINDPVLSNKAISLDSLKKLYAPETIFINFEDKPVYTPPPGQEHLPPLGIPDKQDKKHRKEKRRSDLWMLWIVAGGTFLGIGLSGSRKRVDTKATHA